MAFVFVLAGPSPAVCVYSVRYCLKIRPECAEKVAKAEIQTVTAEKQLVDLMKQVRDGNLDGETLWSYLLQGNNQGADFLRGCRGARGACRQRGRLVRGCVHETTDKADREGGWEWQG